MELSDSRNIQKKQTLTGVVIIIIFFIFNIWRCRYTFYGYDEVYYSALPYSFLLGKQPFGYMCSIHQLPMLFNVPFVWIWHEVTNGSMEGIILFLRILYCMIVFAITLYLYATLKKDTLFSVVTSVMICGVFIVFVPASIYSLSYNTIPYTMLIFSSLLLYNGIYHKRILVFFAGIAYAIAVQAYPLLIVSVLIPIIFIIFCMHNRKKKQIVLSEMIFFSGAFVVLLVLVVVIWSFNGFINLLNMVTGDNVHYNTNAIAQGSNPVFAWVRNVWYSLDIRLMYLIVFFTLASISMLHRKIGGNPFIKNVFIYLWLCICIGIYTFLFICFFENFEALLGYLPLPFTLMFPALFFINRCRDGKWVFLYLLGCIHSITILVSSYNSLFFVSMYGLMSSTIACLGLLKSTLAELDQQDEGKGRKTVAIASIMMLLFLLGYTKFGYLYGETGDFSSLTSKIRYGPAKGVITNQETCENYYGLYHDISQTLDNDGDICFGNRLPIGYLCTDNTPNCRTVLATDPTVEMNDIYYQKVQQYPKNVYFVKKELRGFEGCSVDIEEPWNTEFGKVLKSDEYEMIETEYFYIYRKVE